ncbi:hypothetical protein GXW83_16215 [Streptacidiphilus sp. PB12-B1b]|uniref:hypothetical protein n=1 Tax=Streptacidiphilus sp. PB12-B1b TaxID=2705012 RepID=UPI0015FAB20F|nr:hypothetical protein [Streptacidiphilus sp. PB12-B1b]QMU77019.1 hypothetical protein GXW83_16215 [Streptacidiphilus sp. PB12-B1b]
MAEASTTTFESVIAGIRGYLNEQLGELERELDAARQAVTQLNDQLTSKQSSIEGLIASRDLLAAKLRELDGALAESATVTLPRQSRAEADTAAAPQDETVAAVRTVEAVEAVAEPAAAEAAQPEAAPTAPAKARKLNGNQRNVLGFLETTPGVHKVSEIAAAVNGPDADNAATQAVRRALATLTRTGLATKSTQSGTAFYSAAETATGTVAVTEAAAVVAEAVEAVQPVEAAEEAAAESVAAAPKARTRKAATRTAPKKAAPKKAAPKKAAKATGAKKTAKRPSRAVAATPAETIADAPSAAAETPSTPARARKRAAKKVAAASPADAGERTLRADRAKIVATLQAATEPQSAGDVSRTVMGDEWRTSDATNFRKVLKSMATEGVVAEHVGENNRARYTAASGA